MALETNFNQSPYFDDFDENKNFHRVLFRPGYAVQARELTQLQTILQNQIERFANEILVDGTIVSGVGITTDSKLSYVKLRDKDANSRVLLLGDFYTNGVIANAVVTGSTSGVTGQLIDVKEGSEATAPNYLSIFVKYTNSGSNNTTKAFLDNEVIIVRRRSNNEFLVAANTIDTDATGYGYGASVTDGIIYHKGNFVRVPSQRITVEKYSTIPNKKLGFQTTESIIDSNQDSSLLDNATGATNFSAPGANRLKLTPTLAVRELSANTANTTTFFTIARIEDGSVITKTVETVYSDIGKYVASRLYETHGNYAVEPFNIRIREHLRDETNLGRYNSDGGGSINKLVSEIERGVGYVNGNRISINSNVFRDVDKAVDYEVKDARVIGHTIGNYVFAQEVVGIWDLQQFKTVSLRDSIQGGISGRNLGDQSAQGTEIGTAKVRGIQWHSGTSGTATARFRIYLFDIQMNSGKSFSQVRSLFIAGSSLNSMADIVLEGGIAKIQEPGLNTLVFPFTQRGTKTLRDADNNVDTQFVFRTEKSVSFNTSGQVTFSPNTAHTGGTETFNDTGSPLTNVDERNFIIVTKETATSTPHTGTISVTSGNTVTGSSTTFTTDYKVGEFIRFNTGSGDVTHRITEITNNTTIKVANSIGSFSGLTASHRSVFPKGYIFDLSSNGSITASSSSATIDLGLAPFTSGFTASVYFNILRSSAVQASKVVNKNKFVKINTGSHSAGKNGPWSLGVPDVHKIVAIYKGSNTGVTESDTDVTSEFILDDGMKDAFYDISYLKKKSTSTLDLTNSGILVKMNYFTRNYTSGIGFLSADSYPINDANTSSTSTITTQEIPIFISPTTGIRYDLRDSVDYRPIKAASATPNASAASAPTNPAGSTTYAIDSDGSYIPTPDENFQADIQFYLPRKDRIVLNEDGSLEVIKGIPNLLPKTPDEKTNSMTLAILNVPPYPSLSPFVAKQYGRIDYQTTLSIENNRRYTMKDLRTIDQRVKTLEYYSSLNALENSAKSKQLFNDSGLDRFKNGFLVDNFDGHNVADTTNRAYRAAVDRYNTSLRPTFEQDFIGMSQSTTLSGSNITKTGDLILLSYTHETLLDQAYASKQRNCVQELTFNWKGEIVLDPSMDNTPDITTLPEIQVDFDGMYQSIEEIVARTGITGIDWGNWRTTNINTSTAQESEEIATRNSITTTTTTTALTTTEQIRQGIQTSVSPSTETFSFGNFVESVAVRGFMRSKLVRFTGVRLKPNTRVYPYFDDELVSEYCTPANSSFANTNSEGTSLVTDSTGTVYGLFRIPNDSRLKFRIGTKKFELKDVANTQTQSSLITTSASGDYTSIPLDVSVRGSSVNIKTPQIAVSTVVETQQLTDIQVRTSSTSTEVETFVDPISQTFYVASPKQTDGAFITKVDLFFAKKSSTYPITLQIREVVNGYPTSTIVSLGSKTLQASQVSANSTVATTATTFTFDSPVYLKNNTEYAFTVIPGGNSDEYALWTAELGRKDVSTNETIDKQPASGVMFVSANDRTWSAIQNEDIKYKIYRAKFTTSTGTVYVNNDAVDFFTIDNRNKTFNIGEKVSGESTLVIANNSLISVGQIIQSKAAKDQLAVTNTNFANGVVRSIVTTGTGTVTIKIDNFGQFPTSSSANTNNLYVGSTWIGNTSSFTANTAKGFVQFIDTDNNKLHIDGSTAGFDQTNKFVRGQVSGASARITAVNNLAFNAIVPKIPQLTYSNTTSTWSARLTSTGGTISTSYKNVDLGVENEFIDGEKKIYGATNEASLTAVSGSRKTLVLRGTISTTNEFVSPVIDTSRMNILVIKNNINNQITEEHKDAGDSQVRYISRPVVLEDGQEAEDLTVFLTAYKPQGTNVLVYARIHNPEDPQAFSDKDFSPLRQVTSSNTFSDSVDRNDFKEFEFTFPANTDGQNFLGSSNSHAYLNTGNSDVVAYRSSDGSIYHTYKTFAIKIVMTSTGTNIIPIVNDMRAIALQK